VTVRLWRVAITAPNEQMADHAASLFGDRAEAITAFELEPGAEWLVQGFTERRPDARVIEAGLAMAALALGLEAPELTIEPVENIDWLRRNQESFPPLRIGRYFVYGSHFEGIIPGGAIPLRIDAATAFGTGEHASTEGCLTALDRLARRTRPLRVLDMGTGTGILAIAAAKTWHIPVLACDIDPHSVEVAAENVHLNGVSAFVTCRPGDGYNVNELRRCGPFDLIFANILARPLARMAPDLARNLAPGSIAILSGLLATQEPFVAAAHRMQGLRQIGRVPIGSWHTLVFRQSVFV
jgi:ribosomal protein L11 methyltransferase